MKTPFLIDTQNPNIRHIDIGNGIPACDLKTANIRPTELRDLAKPRCEKCRDRALVIWTPIYEEEV